MEKSADLAFLLSTISFVSIVAISTFRAHEFQPIWSVSPQQFVLTPVLNSIPTDRSIVVENPYDYPQEWWYALPEVRKRMIYLTDMNYALSSKKNFLAEMSLTVDHQIVPMPLESYTSFVERNSRFYLLSSSPKEFLWTAEHLSRDGWKLIKTASSETDALYDVSKD